MTNYSKSVLIFSMLIVGCAVSAPTGAAQPICPLKRFEMRVIRGKVADRAGEQKPVPINGARIELKKVQSNERLLETVFTNSEGNFEFLTVKRGTYRLTVFLVVNGVDVFPGYQIIVHLKGPAKRQKAEGLYIQLEPDCANTTVQLRERI